MKHTILRLLALALCLALLGTGAMGEASGLPEGEYAPDGFTFSGGTGKVTISCPKLSVAQGAVTATLVFSSPNYPKLTVDGVEYTAAHEEKNSVFEIPARVNEDMTVVGTTTAMSTPHDVEYVIHIWVGETPSENLPAEEDDAPAEKVASVALADREKTLPGLTWQSEMALRYAHEFAVDYYEGGYKLLTVGDGNRYLVVPEGGDIPAGLDGDVGIIRQPLNNVYLAATAAMALFDAVDGLDVIRLSGTRAEGWTIENAADAMKRGDMVYAGKYSAPDYELLMGMDCPLAIESTMILHTPKVQEMLEQLGVTVFIEHSSYESHPLGRTEWVKLYAAMLNREDMAEAFFDDQARVIDELKDFPNTEKKVAFFYISSDGSVVVRGANDYVAGMIELAGGRYIFSDDAALDSARAAVNISMEDFYAAAVDADYLIYNASIDTPLNSLDDLLGKSALFADFRAVKDGNVWSTDKYLFQATDIVGELITDINRMLTGQAEGMTFIHRLQ